MKKIYFSALAIIAGLSSVSAQIQQQPMKFGELVTNPKAVKQSPKDVSKALGIVIYENDFDNAGDWVIDNDGQAGGAFGWTIDATSDGWYSAGGINSTSGGSYAEVSNGNAQMGTQALDVTYTLTLANSIDIVNLPLNTGNSDQVSLQYEQYGALFNDQQTVEISVDGGANWQVVRDNRDHHGVLSASGGSAYPNPELVTINLAPYVTGNASDFQLRFVWTTAFPASATNPNVWITYGWYIDDIKLVTNPDNDLETSNAYWGRLGLNYYQIPNTQLAALDFAVDVTNNGINPQTNAQLNVDITGAGTASASSTGLTVAPNTTEALEIVGGFTPTVNGTYNIAWDVTQTEVDDVPSNDVIQGDAFQVVDYIWARDKGNTPTGTFNNQGIGYKLGNLFDMVNDQTVYSVQTRLSNTSTMGAEFQAKIYWLPSTAATLDDMVEIGFSDFIQVSASNVNQIINIDLLAPVTLGADSTIFVAIESAGDAGATNGVVVSTSGTALPQTVFLYDDQDVDWFYTTGTPIIRLNFQENGVGIEENENQIGLHVYPNPAQDAVNVSFNLADAANAVVKVIDVAGKEVASQASANSVSGAQNFTINTNNFAAGVYTVVVEHNNGTNTTKFIKK